MPLTRFPLALQAGWPARGILYVVLVLAALASNCRPGNPDGVREDLHRSTLALKQDSVATRTFFETLLADSIQRERLARVILENEGMRRTLTQALIADSLAELRESGVPGGPPVPAAPPAGPTPSDASAEPATTR